MNRRERIKGMLPVLRDRQKSMDEAIAFSKEGRSTSCDTCTSPGCCYQTVMAQLSEAVLIATHLKKEKLDTPILRKRLRETGRSMETTPRPEWFSKVTPCVFLTDDKCCSIYEIRPMRCRTYFVVSPSENCQPPESLLTAVVDMRRMVLDELDHLTAIHTFWGLEETRDKMYMRSLPLAVYSALKFIEEPTKQVLEKQLWPSVQALGQEPRKPGEKK